jgi:exosortase/archaeosortase family protein
VKSWAAPLSLWPGIAAFLGWGVVLSFLQWAVERSAPVLWLTERLAAGLGYGLGGLVNVPTQVDGTVVRLFGSTQEVTPNCFGFAAVTFLLAAVLATPAGWRARLKGAGLGLVAIVLANAARLVMLAWFFAYAVFAFGFVHIPVWGTVVPLFLVGVWALWVVRDLHYFPRIPLRFIGLVSIFVVLLLAGWYMLLDRYLVVLIHGVNAVLTTLVGVPIVTLRLTVADLLRHLDVGLPSGGFRLEIAAQTLNIVPCLALILASPIALGRRLRLALCGLAALFVLHGAATGVLIILGWSAPGLVPVFQIANDFVSLAAGPSLWLLLTRPSRAWVATLAGDAPAALVRGVSTAGKISRRRSIVSVIAWSAIAVSARLLAGPAVAAAGDPETFVNLTRALQNLAEKTNPTSSLPRVAAPEALADFTLGGVVIAGEIRLALVQSAGASSGSPELLPVGAVLAGYRLPDIEEEQVTLGGQRGERKLLELRAGGSLAR